MELDVGPLEKNVIIELPIMVGAPSQSNAQIGLSSIAGEYFDISESV